METASSDVLENELTIPTTCAGSTGEKGLLHSVSAGCCESGQTGSDQDCFIVDGNIEEQMSSHFQHNSGMNREEEMEITFSRSVYGEIGDKDVGSFHSEGTCLYFVLIFFKRCSKVRKPKQGRICTYH